VKRERLTQIVLVIAGLLNLAMIYFLYSDLRHSRWLLVQKNETEPMFLSFFIPVGVFLLMAARRRVSTTLRQVFTKFSEFFICCQFSTRKFASGSPRNDDRQLDGPTACPFLSVLEAHCVFPKSSAAGN
jgi:hypothetical protein